jgi:hypothetical protein
MEDLANERNAVCRKLEEFNFEPVNAENLMPDGTNSWQRIQRELAESDLMVLILGESYGWIPTSGPHADAGKAVTELEFLEAQRLGLPVLPFVKRIKHPGSTPDFVRREELRRRIEDWDGGLFRANFDLAHDLADHVARALIEFLGGHYLREAAGTDRASRTDFVTTRPAGNAPPLPSALVEAVRARSAVVLIGSGVSLEAGLPSADLFIAAMRQRIEQHDPTYRPAASGSLFFAVAADLEALLGPNELRRVVGELVTPKYFAGTTDSHRRVIELFDVVITTNYDDLLERAVDRDLTVVSDDATLVDLAKHPAIIKLHGSLNRPESLVLTEGELAGVASGHPRVREALVRELRCRPLIAVGSSLRDPSLVSVLEAARPDLRGWVVADRIPLADRARIQRWNLDPLEGDAHAFFAALLQAVHGASTDGEDSSNDYGAA